MLRLLLSRLRRKFLGDYLWRLPHELPADLSVIRREMDILRLNVKTFGYQLARELGAHLSSVDVAAEPRPHGLKCMPARQRDIESPWFGYWCQQLKIAPVFHRKLWEYAFILQALFERGKLGRDLRGLGFGCGEEPMARLRFVERSMTTLKPGA